MNARGKQNRLRSLFFSHYFRGYSHAAVSHVRIAAVLLPRSPPHTFARYLRVVFVKAQHTYVRMLVWWTLFVAILCITAFQNYGNVTFSEWKHSKCAIPVPEMMYEYTVSSTSVQRRQISRNGFRGNASRSMKINILAAQFITTVWQFFSQSIIDFWKKKKEKERETKGEKERKKVREEKGNKAAPAAL